jgi:hypothetical protein
MEKSEDKALDDSSSERIGFPDYRPRDYRF